MEKGFSEYAIKNNLDIELDLEIIKYDKPTDSYSYFKSLVESLIKKPQRPYEIYFYESKFTNIYGKYLLNLNDYLPKDHIKMYDSRVLSEECTYKDKLVGIVNIQS